MLLSAPRPRAAHATDVHIGDSIDEDVGGRTCRRIEAMLPTRHATSALAAAHTVSRWIGCAQATTTADVAVTL